MYGLCKRPPGTVGYRRKARGPTLCELDPPWAVVRKLASFGGNGVTLQELLTIELGVELRNRRGIVGLRRGHVS